MVERLPPVLNVNVPWRAEPVPVVSVDEVEQTRAECAEVLARWRELRDRDVA